MIIVFLALKVCVLLASVLLPIAGPRTGKKGKLIELSDLAVNAHGKLEYLHREFNSPQIKTK